MDGACPQKAHRLCWHFNRNVVWQTSQFRAPGRCRWLDCYDSQNVDIQRPPDRWLATLADWLEKHSLLSLAIFSVVFLGVTSAIGATKLLEFDELYTYYPAKNATLSQVWSFYAQGLDTNTPVASVLVNVCLRLFGDNPLALRLPVILGYWIMCLGVYAFVAFRCSKVYAMAAMLSLPITSVYFYAT